MIPSNRREDVEGNGFEIHFNYLFGPVKVKDRPRQAPYEPIATAYFFIIIPSNKV